MRFIAKIQEMAESEILLNIPASIHEGIKAKDPRPLYRAYAIGHEGEAKGKMVEGGTIIKRWFASAIRKLTESLQYGMKVFHNHGKTNEHEGRKTIGQIVGRVIEDIKDKLTAIAIVYIEPEFRDLPLDVASIEANVNLRNENGIEDVDVVDVTGIALGNSKVNRPGFANASLLAELQAFYKSSVGRQSQFAGKGVDMDFTIEDIRAFLKSEKVRPSDLYSVEALGRDPVVRGLAEDRVEERIGAEFKSRKVAEEELEKIKTESAKREADLKKENADLKIGVARSQVKDLFATEKTSRKLSDRQVKFIERGLDSFVPADPARTKEEFAKFLDTRIEEFGVVSGIFGIEPEKKGEAKPGAETEDKKRSTDEGGDELNPAKNPFIKRLV